MNTTYFDSIPVYVYVRMHKYYRLVLYGERTGYEKMMRRYRNCVLYVNKMVHFRQWI